MNLPAASSGYLIGRLGFQYAVNGGEPGLRPLQPLKLHAKAVSEANMTQEIPPNPREDQFGFIFSIHFALENLVSLS